MIVKKTHRGRPIEEVGFNSVVDIIIPFHGQYKEVTRAVESIMRCTQNGQYKICLVDDCSPNEYYLGEFLAQIPSLKLIRCEERKGFGGAIEAGFNATNNPYCVFMNSDCVVEDLGWLRNLGDTLVKLKSKNVRMVAPLTNNAVGGISQQVMSKEDFNLGDRTDRSDAILDVKQGEYLSMYCFMCHRELFRRCGGFIKNYPYGWYEDMEFAHRMNHFGYKQAVATTSWIYHEGECTIKELWRRDQASRAIMTESNEARCKQDLQKLYSKKSK